LRFAPCKRKTRRPAFACQLQPPDGSLKGESRGIAVSWINFRKAFGASPRAPSRNQFRRSAFAAGIGPNLEY